MNTRDLSFDSWARTAYILLSVLYLLYAPVSAVVLMVVLGVVAFVRFWGLVLVVGGMIGILLGYDGVWYVIGLLAIYSSVELVRSYLYV